MKFNICFLLSSTLLVTFMFSSAPVYAEGKPRPEWLVCQKSSECVMTRNECGWPTAIQKPLKVDYDKEVEEKKRYVDCTEFLKCFATKDNAEKYLDITTKTAQCIDSQCLICASTDDIRRLVKGCESVNLYQECSGGDNK